MNFLRLIFLLLIALMTGGAAAQSQYEATPGSMIEAIARGEARECRMSVRLLLFYISSSCPFLVSRTVALPAA